MLDQRPETGSIDYTLRVNDIQDVDIMNTSESIRMSNLMKDVLVGKS